MPVSFKQRIFVTAYTKTPADELILCSDCGGLNALGRVAVQIDCTTCNMTGYENYYTAATIPAYYIPGGIKRWDVQRGGVVYNGEAAIKVDAVYEDSINSAEYLELDGIRWQFTSVSDPGKAFGQRRLLLALNRKE